MTHNQTPTDALATLGTILTEQHGRDAIHLAVLSATARHVLMRGTHIGIGADGLASNSAKPYLGIVDPFLKGAVQPGEQFWLMLYPRTITSLRHVWAHPSIPDEPETTKDNKSKEASEAWLRAFCNGADCAGYTAVMGAIRDGHYSGDEERVNNDPSEWSVSFDGEYIHHNGSDSSGIVPPEFWDHAETVLGRKIQHSAETYFSCSC
jgi:hypothetical protein